jgi:hypothetical protein
MRGKAPRRARRRERWPAARASAQNQRQQQAQAQQVQQANSQGLANYNKAVSACLAGRGYTVK